jgi:hypothetical protein
MSASKSKEPFGIFIIQYFFLDGYDVLMCSKDNNLLLPKLVLWVWIRMRSWIS